MTMPDERRHHNVEDNVFFRFKTFICFPEVGIRKSLYIEKPQLKIIRFQTDKH